MDGAAHQGRRPRPVADTPAVDAAAVAKGWLIALVAGAPLHEAGAVPATELARSGPALCAAILAALSSDAELERLLAPAGEGRPSPAASAARLTGARTPAGVADGVEALRGAFWHALHAELRDPHPALVADLADRLAFVCARVAAAALTPDAAQAPRREGPLAEALAGREPWTPPVPAPAPDEREPAVRVPAEPPQGVQILDPLSTLAEELDETVSAVGLAAEQPYAATAAPTVTRLRGPEVHAHDGTPWLAAIERRLERREHDRLPFAVLVVEVDDLERLAAAERGREVGLALERAERGLTAELAPADLVVRERLGRWWLTTPDRDAPAARELAHRVAAAIGSARLAGAPLKASVGVAVCPDDGEQAVGLAGRADEAMFLARASGVPVAE